MPAAMSAESTAERTPAEAPAPRAVAARLTAAETAAAVKYLHAALKKKTNECVLNERRVDVFKGAAGTRALMDAAYARVHGAPDVGDEDRAHAVLQALVAAGFLARVKSLNQTRFVQAEPGRPWSDDALYAWLYEGSQLLPMLAGFAVVVAIFVAFLYPLWPAFIRTRVSVLMSWAMWAGVGFLVFMFVTSIVRVIVYALTVYAVPPGIWIFPNLWEDCGFFESFWPLYAWERVLPAEKQE